LFQILYTQEARERLLEISKFDPKSARIIYDHIARLPACYPDDPFLQGPAFRGLRRNRSGRYRVIYRVLELEQKIHVITVDLRKSAYE
jgi:mRNA-degrading endonuclease RelE of RelBE toxin-antitoxin system